MKHSQWAKLISTIEARPEFKSLTVLDRGTETVLVLTKSDTWFLYSQGQWQELDSMEANSLCHRNHFPNRWSEMQDAS